METYLPWGDVVLSYQLAQGGEPQPHEPLPVAEKLAPCVLLEVQAPSLEHGVTRHDGEDQGQDEVILGGR